MTRAIRAAVWGRGGCRDRGGGRLSRHRSGPALDCMLWVAGKRRHRVVGEGEPHNLVNMGFERDAVRVTNPDLVQAERASAVGRGRAGRCRSALANDSAIGGDRAAASVSADRISERGV